MKYEIVKERANLEVAKGGETMKIDYDAIIAVAEKAMPENFKTVSSGNISQAEAISRAIAAAIAEYERQINSDANAPRQ